MNKLHNHLKYFLKEELKGKNLPKINQEINFQDFHSLSIKTTKSLDSNNHCGYIWNLYIDMFRNLADPEMKLSVYSTNESYLNENDILSFYEKFNYNSKIDLSKSFCIPSRQAICIDLKIQNLFNGDNPMMGKNYYLSIILYPVVEFPAPFDLDTIINKINTGDSRKYLAVNRMKYAVNFFIQSTTGGSTSLVDKAKIFSVAKQFDLKKYILFERHGNISDIQWDQSDLLSQLEMAEILHKCSQFIQELLHRDDKVWNT